MGKCSLRLIDGLDSVARFSHHLEIRLPVENRSHSLPEQGVLICQEYTDGFPAPASHPFPALPIAAWLLRERYPRGRSQRTRPMTYADYDEQTRTENGSRWRAMGLQPS